MKLIVKIIFLLLFFSAYSQEKDFFVVDNSHHSVYKIKKVKRLKSFKTDLLSGEANGKYLEIIRDFDKNGNIIKEREYYDKDTLNGINVKHIYNKNHKVLKSEWFWLDDGVLEITEYEYNENGNLKKSCDYVKKPTFDSRTLQNCRKYIYRKGFLKKVIPSSKSDSQIDYKRKDSLIIKYSNKGEIVSKYLNGDIVYLNKNSDTTIYTRNEKGQLTKIETKNIENNILETYTYEYKDELLRKVIKKNSAGHIIEFDEIQYEYYEESDFNPLKRKLIDSIHSKRLCIDYVGLSRFLTTKEAFEESEYVFTGMVTKVIRTEKMEPQDMGMGKDGKMVSTDFEPTYQYWYVLKTEKVYKGKKNEFIKIHSKIFSTISPLLMLNKKYLIYAKNGEFQESPYIYCGGNSCHIEYAENDIIEIEKIIRE